MWNDNDTDLDLLDFRHLVAGILSIANNKNLLPATIGVFGDWGSGKSSLMRMVKKELSEKEDEVLCISFNGWLFEGYDDAKAALLSTIIKEISKRKKLDEKAKEKVKLLLKQINWMRVVFSLGKYATSYYLGGGGAFTLSALPEVSELAKMLAEKLQDVSVEEVEDVLSQYKEKGEEPSIGLKDFHSHFAKLIDVSKIKKLVIFIDDLDRCNPDTIIETLEAIRLFLYAQDTVFIIAADERLVKYAVSRRYPEIPGSMSDISRDYLEKLIQFPIIVPPLGRAEIETYIKLLFASIASLKDKDFEKLREKTLYRDASDLFNVTLSFAEASDILDDVPATLNEGLSLAEYLAPILSIGLAGNPRQTKRFLNTLMIRQQMATARSIELKARVLAKLMLLEYLKPDFFRKLAEIQANQDGKSIEIQYAEYLMEGKTKSKADNSSDEKRENGKDDKTPGGELPELDLSSSSDFEKLLPDELDTQSKKQIADISSLWASDPWMIEWLSSEPKLSKIDLRPYFYFSRDTLSPQRELIRRLSPIAQEVVSNLLSLSDALIRKGFEIINSLSPSEAALIFESIVEKISVIEIEQEREKSIGILFDLVNEREDLSSQLLNFLQDTPENKIPLSAVPRLKQVISGNEFNTIVMELIKKWATNESHTALAQAAKNEINQSP